MKRMMVDIETFDTRPSSIVFQVGACLFDDHGDCSEKMLWHIDVVPQIMLGRTFDHDTQKFWMAQKKESWERPHKKLSSVYDMVSGLNAMAVAFNVEEVWSNSPSFDAVILRSLAETFRVSLVWDFRKDRDVRTLKKMAADLGWEEVYLRETTHNALDDCVDQVNTTVSALQHLQRLWKLSDDMQVQGLAPED